MNTGSVNAPLQSWIHRRHSAPCYKCYNGAYDIVHHVSIKVSLFELFELFEAIFIVTRHQTMLFANRQIPRILRFNVF